MVVSALAKDELDVATGKKIDEYLELLKAYYRSGEPDCVPNASTYRTAIRAWSSNGDDKEAVLRARALLHEMHQLAKEGAENAKPGPDTYLVYLEGLSKSSVEEKEELAKDALSLIKRDQIELDGLLLLQMQRCWLPVDFGRESWVVPSLDDSLAFPESLLPSEQSGLCTFP